MSLKFFPNFHKKILKTKKAKRKYFQIVLMFVKFLILTGNTFPIDMMCSCPTMFLTVDLFRFSYIAFR